LKLLIYYNFPSFVVVVGVDLMVKNVLLGANQTQFYWFHIDKAEKCENKEMKLLLFYRMCLSSISFKKRADDTSIKNK
jgi:hypothetical protein